MGIIFEKISGIFKSKGSKNKIEDKQSPIKSEVETDSKKVTSALDYMATNGQVLVQKDLSPQERYEQQELDKLMQQFKDELEEARKLGDSLYEIKLAGLKQVAKMRAANKRLDDALNASKKI